MDTIDIKLLTALIAGIAGAIVAVVKWLDLRTSTMIAEAKSELEQQISDLRDRVKHLETNGREARQKLRDVYRWAVNLDDVPGSDDAVKVLDEVEEILA